jgi:hypothetical protein
VSTQESTQAPLESTQLALLAGQGVPLVSSPLFFPQEFKHWLSDFVAVGIPMIPYSHIFGSHVNIARSIESVSASESTTAAGYKDLTTVGPEITELADGKYLVAYGATSRDYTSISINGSTPVDTDAIYGHEFNPAAAFMKVISVKENNLNTLKLQYKGTRVFSFRWLFAMRIGAPGA